MTKIAYESFCLMWSFLSEPDNKSSFELYFCCKLASSLTSVNDAVHQWSNAHKNVTKIEKWTESYENVCGLICGFRGGNWRFGVQTLDFIIIYPTSLGSMIFGEIGNSITVHRPVLCTFKISKIAQNKGRPQNKSAQNKGWCTVILEPSVKR